MGTDMLINTFVGSAGAKPAPSELTATSHTKHSSSTPADNASLTGIPQTTTADNTAADPQNESINERRQDFDHTLHEKITLQTTQKGQNEAKLKTKNATSETLQAPNQAQPASVQELQLGYVELSKITAAEVSSQFQEQTGGESRDKSAPLIAVSKVNKSPTLIVQAAKPITTKLGQIVSVESKPEDKLSQSTIDQSQIESKTVLPDIFKGSLVTDTQSGEAKQAGQIQVSDNAFVAKENFVNQQNGKESMRETLPGGAKMTITSEKPVITDELPVPSGAETTGSTEPVITSTPPSSQQNQQSGKESIPKTLFSDNKTIAALQDQSSHSRQEGSIGQESPAQAGEETTGNKADTDPKDHRGKMELFELPEKDRVQVENLSVKSIAQNISPPRVRLSAPQAENRSSLLSDHGPNPDMELSAQVLVGNNAQLPVTEQSSASTPFTKIADNADSGASVSEQIQESIRSSLHQGNQQITVRLSPPELGKVLIKFQEQGGQVTGSLEVSKTQTRYEIQQALPEIIQNLQDSGIQIKRLDVVLTNQQEQQTLKDQSSTAGQDSWSGPQNSPNPRSQSNNMTYNEWLTNIDIATEFNEPQVQLAHSSINMLI